jgi:hypothetical protein
LFYEDEEDEEEVVGMEYLVCIADVGLQVFQFIQDDEEEVGMQVFHDKEEVRIERLADVGIEEEEEDVGNHVRKEPIPYSVNYKESVL